MRGDKHKQVKHTGKYLLKIMHKLENKASKTEPSFEVKGQQEIKSSVILLSDKHNYIDLAYLVFSRYCYV